MSNNKNEIFNYKKENNYKAILFKIENEEKVKESRFLRIVAMLVIAIIGTTGIAVASNIIYNEYIKKSDKVELKELFYYGESELGKIYSNDILDDMIYDKETELYYKVIEQEETYKQYKKMVNELPEISDIDFQKNLIMIITAGLGTEPYLYRRDLVISEINADEETTYITLVPNENPNYDKLRTELYVVFDKTLLRDDVKIKIDTSVFNIKGITPISKLPKEYSKEEAINDGCMVIERPTIDDMKFIVISENKYALDELIEKSEKGVESYIRIYLEEMQYIKIMDIQYKNGIFIITSGKLGNANTFTQTFKYITKDKFKDNTYLYQCNNTKKDPLYSSNILLFITFD